MNDFDDELCERELFARRAFEAATTAPAGGAGMKLDIDDVLARVDAGQGSRARRARVVGFARVVSQAGTAFAAAAACLALVRGPSHPSDAHAVISRDDPTRLLATAASDRTASSGGASGEAAESLETGLACNPDNPSDNASSSVPACESPTVTRATPDTTETLAPAILAPTILAPAILASSSPLACEARSCGDEVTCGAGGP